MELLFIASQVAAVLLVLLMLVKKSRRAVSLKGKHVLITGGSSGIGKALAVEAAAQGASAVTLLARNEEKLLQAKNEVLKSATSENQKVQCFSVDVSKDFEGVKQVVEQAINEAGNVFALFNCAGTSIAYAFTDTPIEEFKRMMDLNYFGSVYTTKAVLPSMKTCKEGKVVLVSSIAGLFGVYGYTAYSASKFALRGLAECLNMEVKLYNITVTLALPPDTDTPGFAEEEKTKPLETRLISESGGLFSPQQVARKILSDTLKGNFMSTVGFQGWLVATACSGASPFSSLAEVLVQAILMGPIRLLGIYVQSSFESIVKKCAEDKASTQ